ncbi:MAG TPA: peptidoglycan bridge formation glycyltransferase FemA/FemB family protein [Anaerolineae bacterium]|nr:peptidoglycan bridge formation glycyltransferase FemA/FemB family protein [Anaerolineae bacterium]
MSSLRVITPRAAEWDAFLAARPDAHILQTSAWGELKSRFGWSAERIAVLSGERIAAGASVLFRRLPLRLGTLAYIPKGPIIDLDDGELTATLLAGLDRLCRSRRALLLKLEPDALDAQPFARFGFRPSPHAIQPPRTIVIDIARGEDDLLAAMHPKTRYNIRLASKKGVTVRAAVRADLPAFNALMQATGARDGFAVHAPAYYEWAFDLFAPASQAQLFLAEVAGQMIAGLFAFAHGQRAWYFYGASGEAHREYMPNHALQWHAIRWAKSIGCCEYDLWGIPDADEATLEAEYLHRRDDLWGVYRFKRGFGGSVVRFAGAWDRVHNPLLYRIYLLALKYRGVE